MSIDLILAAERALLARLETFARTSEYGRLRAVVLEQMGADQEPWLARWLVRPTFDLSGLPIDIAQEPGGVDMLTAQLARIAHNCS